MTMTIVVRTIPQSFRLEHAFVFRRHFFVLGTCRVPFYDAKYKFRRLRECLRCFNCDFELGIFEDPTSSGPCDRFGAANAWPGLPLQEVQVLEADFAAVERAERLLPQGRRRLQVSDGSLGKE